MIAQIEVFVVQDRPSYLVPILSFVAGIVVTFMWISGMVRIDGHEQRLVALEQSRIIHVPNDKLAVLGHFGPHGSSVAAAYSPGTHRVSGQGSLQYAKVRMLEREPMAAYDYVQLRHAGKTSSWHLSGVFEPSPDAYMHFRGGNRWSSLETKLFEPAVREVYQQRNLYSVPASNVDWERIASEVQLLYNAGRPAHEQVRQLKIQTSLNRL